MRCNDARDATANPLYDGVIDTLVSVGSTFGWVGATRGPEVFPAKPLVSYQTYRQLSGWILPPLVIRAFSGHTSYLGMSCCLRRWSTRHLIAIGEPGEPV